MEWSLYGGDSILFIQALVMLQTKFMELKIVEQELEIVSCKKKEALVDLDSKTKLANEELESKKKRNVELELCASAEKEGTIARIKIELDFTKRKCDAELEKLTKKPRPMTNKLKSPVLMRLIKNRLPSALIGKCEIIGCDNEISHLHFYALSKHGFIENGENFNEILVVCGLHARTNSRSSQST